MTRGLVALATLCICAAPTGAQSLNAPARGIADSLSTIGDMEFTNGWLDSAEAYYDRALAVDPSHGRSTVGLARLSLAADSVDAAERLFALAEEREPDVGHIQYGRGLLALRDGEIAQARYDFEAAVIHDRLHADALLELALIKRKTILGRHIVDRAYRKAIEAYPQHPRSHLEYGRYKREAGFTEEAIELFRQQLEVYPRSGDAHIELGSLLLDGGQTWHARRLFMNAFEVTLRREVEICLLVAATYMADRQFPMARDFYAQALEVMAPQDRSLFEDISPIAGLDLAQRARDLTGPERVAFLERFWLERDPTPITPINERLLEHLRRVSYSRIHFSQHVHPWDDRGTVYVRYGEPDHRTTSSRPNLLTPRGVEVVRERYLRLLYGSNVPTLLLDSTQPAYPLDDPANLDFDPNSGKLLGYFPGAGGQALGDEENTDVIFGTEGGSARKRWEVWTYSSLGRGTQFTFADPTMGGTFSFAQPPPTENQHLAARLVELAPAEEFDVLSRSIPDRYAYDTRLDPLNFYYYTAQFRARANQTRIDVCYGIPLSQMMFRERDGEFSAVIESGVAVYDTLWNVRGRTKDRATLRTDENPGEKLSAIQTDMRSIYMPGGRHLGPPADVSGEPESQPLRFDASFRKRHTACYVDSRHGTRRCAEIRARRAIHAATGVANRPARRTRACVLRDLQPDARPGLRRNAIRDRTRDPRRRLGGIDRDPGQRWENPRGLQPDDRRGTGRAGRAGGGAPGIRAGNGRPGRGPPCSCSNDPRSQER